MDQLNQLRQYGDPQQPARSLTGYRPSPEMAMAILRMIHGPEFDQWMAQQQGQQGPGPTAPPAPMPDPPEGDGIRPGMTQY